MRRLFCCCIVAYQRVVSPFLPPACRFYPSCSEYAKEAVTLHGPLRGLYYSLRRIMRCHPWHEGGVDLVPLPSNCVGPCHRR